MAQMRAESVAKPRTQLDEADRELLGKSVRGLLASQWRIEGAQSGQELRSAAVGLWRELAALGATSLGADPEVGGLAEILTVSEELGRAGAVAPFLGAAAANLALAGRGPEAATSLLGGLADGTARVALAMGAFDGDHAAGGGEMSGAEVTGNFALVEDSALATHFLVLVSAPVGATIVAADAPHLSVRETPGLPVPPLADVELRGTPGVHLALDAATVADVVLAVRLTAMSRALGAADRVHELAVEHAKFRRQFGRLIGSFQAIQHKLANCRISLDGTRLLLAQAAGSHDQASPDWRYFANCALAFAGGNLREVSLQSHQALGAIGYSEEHEAPRHFRRVHADTVRFGGVSRARSELADWVLSAPDGAALPGHSGGSNLEAFRQEVRTWLEAHWTDEDRAAHRAKPFRVRGYDRGFSQLMGEAGWIGIGWPKEHGGQNRSPSEQIVFMEECASAGAPIHAHDTGQSTVARALMLHGTDEQRTEWLTAIRRGERSFALGYSESEAGSDLAALRTRAVRDGNSWMVSGEKLWSTGGDKAEYVWLAVRTDPEAEKHAGISVLMVDLGSWGVTIRPSVALYGKTFSALRFDEVRVPAANMVGPVNGGWRVIVDALAAERVMIAAGLVSNLERIIGELVNHVRDHPVGEAGLPGVPVVHDRIGALVADIEVARQLQLRTVRMMESGGVPAAEAAMVKVFASELQARLAQAALDLLGAAALLGEGVSTAPLAGEIEQLARYSIMSMIGGGTNEIQRNIIAVRGLGLPR